jgi:hypothetical protein
MKIRCLSIALALLFLAGCNRSTPPSNAVTTSSVGTASTPAATDRGTLVDAEPEPEEPEVVEEAEQRNVTIESVDGANPVVIRGQARTFENNVALRVRAADRTVIAEGYTTATGEMGRHSPYRGSLWLTREPGRRIIVEAYEHSAKDGSEIHLARVEKPFAIAPVEAVLHFADEGCTAVKPFTRRMPKTVSMARLLVEALVHGPTSAERARGAAVSFPEGSAVQSVILRNGILTVDFNERLQNVGGSCRALMIRDSVTQTLLKLPAVKKVVITAAGSEKLALQP